MRHNWKAGCWFRSELGDVDDRFLNISFKKTSWVLDVFFFFLCVCVCVFLFFVLFLLAMVFMFCF